MSIWADESTTVITQGITGKAGLLHTQACLAYGTKIVGGVTPGKGGQTCEGLKVFDTVREAHLATGCQATMIFVPAPFAKEAILEAEEAGVALIVCITEGMPIQDMLEVSRVMKTSSSRLIGPNCPGIISPGKCKIGIMPGAIHQKGSVGIVSRSGTLTYEAVWQTTQSKLGQSTCVGIGGDPLGGTSFIEVLKAFESDPQTDRILMIGEIGGVAEEDAAEWIRCQAKKPIAAFIAGKSAPKGQTMGHAGAIVEGSYGSAHSKIEALKKAGVAMIHSPADLGRVVYELI